jgi:hypothetical protein
LRGVFTTALNAEVGVSVGTGVAAGGTGVGAGGTGVGVGGTGVSAGGTGVGVGSAGVSVEPGVTVGQGVGHCAPTEVVNDAKMGKTRVSRMTSFRKRIINLLSR